MQQFEVRAEWEIKIPGLKLFAKYRAPLKHGREDSRRGNSHIHKEQGTYEKSPSEQDNEVRGEYQKTKTPLLPPKKKKVCLRNKLNGLLFSNKAGREEEHAGIENTCDR